MNNTLTRPKLDDLWQKCSCEIDFESEVLRKAHNLSKVQMQEEIDKRIDLIASGKIKNNKLKNIKKEAQFLSVMLLRRG